MSYFDEPLVDKWRPDTVDEIQGNNKNIAEIKAWLRDFEAGDQARLLHGPPGTGKTSTAEALSNELDVPLMEINASDARKSDDIERFVDQADSSPITSEYKLVLFDEVDSMSGRANLEPLKDYLDSPSNPTVFVCNDNYEVPQSIKNRVTSYKWKLGVRSRKAKLKEIVQEEDLDLGASTISMLAQRENLRDAIHDLQLLVESEKGLDTENDRSYEGSIFDEIDEVIKGKPVSLSRTPDRSILWVDKNIRGRYRLIELAAAFDSLSRADLWNGRVWQQGDPQYRWWKYSSDLVEAVPYLRLTDAYDGYISKDSPDHYGYDDVSSAVNSVYDKMKGGSESFEFAGDREFFRFKVLPILKKESFETRCKLALEYGLEGSAELDVLDLAKSEYEDWRLSEGDDGDESVEDESFLSW